MAALGVLRSVVLILLYFVSYNSCDGGRLPKRANNYRAELIRRESRLSPFAKAHNLTTPQRVRRSVDMSQRRLERLQALATGRAANFYSPVSVTDNEFIMQMGIGRPSPLLQHMIVDTGSDLIWLQCGPCISCYTQKDALYNPHRSSTYMNVSCNSKFCNGLNSNSCRYPDSCGYSYGYGDGSLTSGNMASETFSLKRSDSASSGWEAIPHIAFGCGNQQEGDFGGVAGLVGLGRGVLSLVSQLGETIKHKFSYCLGSVEDESSVSPLFLGDAPIADLPGKFQSTPFIGVNDSNYVSTFYYLDLHGISVGGTAIKYPASTFLVDSYGNGGLIIDSGTTLTFLADPAYEPFLAAVKSSIKAKPVNASSIGGTDLCYKSTVTVSKLPQIAFHFAGNATFNVPPRNSFPLVEDDLGRKLLCLAYSSAGPEGSLSTFGNIQQQNYNIIYDLGKNKLSFAPAICNSL
ncbi:hypothetical protein SUGI_1168430 [Cryptomeria japonica]|uniref:aspartic proteinase nepenthesin-1-like n=1 Tax=Cryptomeria japonica TaxID=3369 RepID=UPI0024148E49|nr:aspartic proteinase nepenthesin-1-like [Cryptomeria japonica]GLJ54402.1 hypothetical protein SUGI_1168430 [Cryptomeria japonica]